MQGSLPFEELTSLPPGADSVGKSSRTPFKHWVLNSELGRLCGIFAHPLALDKTPVELDEQHPFHVIDLCAGDGVPTSKSERTSPAIISAHLTVARYQNVPVKATFIEKAANAYDLLKMNVCVKAPFVELVHGRAQDYQFKATHPKQAIFIHSDPNHIDDWPITDELIGSLSETTTMLCTLGCNVGGLKRKSLEERKRWYGHMQQVIESLPSYHDAILIAFDRDAHRWAYLLRLPDKWSRRTMESIRKSGQKLAPFDLRIASANTQGREFKSICNYLFLTGKERGVV